MMRRYGGRAWETGVALALAGIALALAACGDPSVLLYEDCDDRMSATRGEFGEPQRIVSDRIDDWHVVVYGYWYLGLTRRFEWSLHSNCKVVDTLYPPLPLPDEGAGAPR